MKVVKTMCARDCPDACWLDVTVDNDVFVKVEASTENPVTNGLTSPRAAGDTDRTSALHQNSLTYGTPQLICGGPMFNTIKVRIRQ